MGIVAAAGFRFEQVTSTAPRTPPLVMLHGSGGSELSLMDFAHSIATDRTAFHLRGGVPWEDRYAFFRRNPDRSLNREDFNRWASKLCDFLTLLNAEGHGKAWLVGYSNGAIMAAATALQAPVLSSGAILLRLLSPRADEDFPPLPCYPSFSWAAPTSDDIRPTRCTSPSNFSALEPRFPSTFCKRGIQKVNSIAISLELGWPSGARGRT